MVQDDGRTAARTPAPTHARRLIGRWWKQQSPARQDHFATIVPLVSVLLFLAAITAAFWYLRHEETMREAEAVKRDTEITAQQLRLRLEGNQDLLQRLARDLVSRELTPEDFEAQARVLGSERPEFTELLWLGAHGERVAGWSATAYHFEAPGQGSAPDGGLAGGLAAGSDSPAAQAFATVQQTRQPVYTPAYADPRQGASVQVHVPVMRRGRFAGALVGQYSIEVLLRNVVPPEIVQRQAISLVDVHTGAELVSTLSVAPGDAPRPAPVTHALPLAPVGEHLWLRGQGWRASAGVVSGTLFWMVVLLSALTVWMLFGSWRHIQRRTQIQDALVAETNFRRAMENSMLTGMRAMDLEGRITYVNPAFCAMTGFAESELVGRLPPYPHWPPERIEESARLLRQELQGRSPAGGIEVKVQRRDGTQFDARMYVSPLVDAHGAQTGWMTSMTNITEAKRIRDQLSAAHERFTTVLEGLDAAVSVLSVQQSELLFANRSYRMWFGADARGHAQLAGQQFRRPEPRIDDSVDSLVGMPTQELTDGGGDPHEVYVEPLAKWFDVRARYLQWTDGRLAQMLIATDISGRRHAEELARQQALKAEVTSRLVTMGEMASSVAHELNQPLTAISNYCSGMVARVKTGSISNDDLVTALEITAAQARRAGQIIHRIRAFVKRSEPQRQRAQAAQIVDNAVDLAGIELKRRRVQIETYVAQHLPPLMVDPILIEQVLINLLKNAAEAIDNAQLPATRRRIELRVLPRHTAEDGAAIEFSVRDDGPGMKPEVLARMYEAFYSTKSDGLGIGLGLCRSIVESHRGRLRAQNLYNGESVVGCRFSFTLPVDLGARTDDHAPPGSVDTARSPTLS
jgi:PAS domain S-box-containing protein